MEDMGWRSHSRPLAGLPELDSRAPQNLYSFQPRAAFELPGMLCSTHLSSLYLSFLT